MKRVLEVIAITLLVVGTELATGAVSHGLDEVVRVYRHLGAGTESDVSLRRFFTGLALLGLGASLVTLDLWARAYSGFVTPGKECPHCGIKTERVKRRWGHRLLGLMLGQKVTYRKCRTCGWHGLTGPS